MDNREGGNSNHSNAGIGIICTGWADFPSNVRFVILASACREIAP